ncbi:MAG TPA: flagellar assembly protein FliX [Pseudolabrys sp.]|jgi:hypothetical protein|nr:flagellar assembly protein FliX [Pseudolabrys sp.]
MRVNGLAGAAATSTPSSARRAGAGGFSVSEDNSAKSPAQAGGLRAISSVDALIALQAVEDPMERRKRAVQKGRKALDVLDGLKISLLEGDLDPSAIGQLKSSVDGLRQGSGDAGLDAVLAEIELRVEVELAKVSLR